MNKTNNLIKYMQFFNLCPDVNVYHEIISNVKLKNELGDPFDMWKKAVDNKYGSLWNLVVDGSFNDEIKKIKTSIITKPTTRLLDIIWYIFFATGDMEYLQIAFEVSGDQKSSKPLREIALETFQNVKQQYKDKILSINKSHPTHFTNHVIKDVLLNSTVFDRFDEIIDKKTKDVFNKLKTDNTKEEEKKKLNDASDKFDEIAKNIINKIHFK